MSGKSEPDRIATRGEDVKIKENVNKCSTYEQVKRKIGKEPIDAKELAVYLSYLKGISNGSLDEKTIRRYIQKLCDMSKGRLKDLDFKQGTSVNSAYLFKPGYHNLLLAFLDTDYFGAKKNDKKLSDRMVLHEQLAENITKYLDTGMQEKIKSDPSYLNALIEGRLSKCITNELAVMLHIIHNSEPVIRYQFMLEVLNELATVRRWMNEWEERIRLIRGMFVKDDEKNQSQDNVESGDFQYDMLDSLMVKLLEAKVNNKEYEYLSEDELLPYKMAYISEKLYDITGLKTHEIYDFLNLIEEDVINDFRYKKIMQKAHRILDRNDQFEREVFESLDKIIKSQIVSNKADISPNNFNKIIRFTEEMVREDKIKIKEILGDTNIDIVLDKTIIDEMMKIKDREDKKKIAGQN